MSLRWDTLPRRDVSIQITAPSCHIDTYVYVKNLWLWEAIYSGYFRHCYFMWSPIYHATPRSLFSNVGPPFYREFYKISIFYLTVCPSVCHFDIFPRNCFLVFSSEILFKKSSYFFYWRERVLNIFENLQIFESYIHHCPPIPVYVQNTYRKWTNQWFLNEPLNYYTNERKNMKLQNKKHNATFCNSTKRKWKIH